MPWGVLWGGGGAFKAGAHLLSFSCGLWLARVGWGRAPVGRRALGPWKPSRDPLGSVGLAAYPHRPQHSYSMARRLEHILPSHTEWVGKLSAWHGRILLGGPGRGKCAMQQPIAPRPP